MQYHEVKINLEFREARDCFWAGTYSGSDYTTDYTVVSVPPSLGATSLFVDYVYLDTDERRRFAQTSHEYLRSNWVEKRPECGKVEVTAFATKLVASSVCVPQTLVAAVSASAA